jgi:NhaP-type Na+/H+ or K+/H+ antiporter
MKVFVVAFIVLSLILSYWAGVIAKRKGKSFVLWCILQLLFYFPIILIAFHSPIEKEK